MGIAQLARTVALLVLAVGMPGPAAGAPAPARDVDPTLVFARSLSTGSANAIAVDDVGSVYVAGRTTEPGFPTTAGVVQPEWRGGASAAFVVKLSPDGAVVWSTLLSGTTPGAEQGVDALAVGPDGAIYAAGFSGAEDFPTTPGAYNGPGPGAFVLKLAPDGSTLLYSTMTSSVVETAGLAVDRDGHAHLLYDSNHVDTGLITPGAFDTGFNESELVVVELDATGTDLVRGTYLGGRLSEFGGGIAVDAEGAVYVTGYTSSGPSFPTTPGTLQPSSPQQQVNGFLTKFRPDGAGLAYSTFLGADVFPRALDVAEDGTAVVAATAISALAVTPGAYDTSPNGRVDTLVTKLDASASTRVFSTLLGGRSDDVPAAVRVAGDGSIAVAGRTQSADFPADGPDASYGGIADGFVATFGADGASLRLSSFVGGGDADAIGALALDGLGGVCVAGTTASPEFAPHATAAPGAVRAFAAKVDANGPFVDAALSAAASGLYVGGRGTVELDVTSAGTAATTGPVTLRATLPDGVLYVAASGTGWTITTGGPRVEATSTDPLAPGERARLTLTVDIAPATVDGALLTAEVSTPGDARAANDEVALALSIAAVPPPTIASVAPVDAPGKPFKVKITGGGFAPGVQVFVGSDATGWSPVARKSSRVLVLKGGDALEARFPVGVDVPIRVRNPDGGEATTTVRR
jgi:hypothetical protein